jgi:hypothetical protein
MAPFCPFTKSGSSRRGDMERGTEPPAKSPANYRTTATASTAARLPLSCWNCLMDFTERPRKRHLGPGGLQCARLCLEAVPLSPTTIRSHVPAPVGRPARDRRRAWSGGGGTGGPNCEEARPLSLRLSTQLQLVQERL